MMSLVCIIQPFVTGNEKYSKIGNKTAAKTATTVQQNW